MMKFLMPLYKHDTEADIPPPELPLSRYVFTQKFAISLQPFKNNAVLFLNKYTR